MHISIVLQMFFSALHEEVEAVVIKVICRRLATQEHLKRLFPKGNYLPCHVKLKGIDVLTENNKEHHRCAIRLHEALKVLTAKCIDGKGVSFIRDASVT